MYEKNPQRKHSELKEPDEMLNKIKTLTTIARQKKAKEKALNEPVKLERSIKKNTLRRTVPTKC